MKTWGKRIAWVIVIAALIVSVIFAAIGAKSENGLYATFWSLVPPLIAIVLALMTKEVYSSLFIGILAGALFYGKFNLETAFNTLLNNGLIGSLSDGWNVGILVFLVVLGIMVQLINRSGGSEAYGVWASQRIKGRKGALGATFGLGVLIFVDDYFNCLTVGSVMRPITDKFQISRAKLAYLIDATAAPICMIAPISSWAAAVSGVVEGTNGISLFVSAIPFNYYSLLTIVMVLFVILTGFDFGSMKVHEENARKGDLFTTGKPEEVEVKPVAPGRGKVADLVLPIIVLIVCCVLGMVYTGGLFSGTSFIDAFAGCDASVGLSLGSMIALLITIVYYLIRRNLKFADCMACVPEGFKSMVPAILILTFAWGLKAMTGLLGADVYVAGLVQSGAASLQVMLPAIIFAIAIGLSFATGTSWGTFGILIPIVVAVLPNAGNMLTLSISACLAGAVCGDHCSPISDTTIMASAGAQCPHVNHVSTQLPYAMLVAIVSFVSYIISGFIPNALISLPIAIVLMLGTLLVMRKVMGGSAKQTKAVEQ